MLNGSKQQSASSTYHLLAGTASGFTSSILLQPFDLLKTRVQQQSSARSSNNAHPSGKLLPPSRSYPVIAALKIILTQPHPIQQLWRGTLPSVIRTSFGSGLYFASLERMRRTLAQVEARIDTRAADQTLTMARMSQRTSALPKLGLTANLLTGGLARASVGFVMMPITVLKVRFESNIYTSAPVHGATGTSYSTPHSSNAYSSLWKASREIARTEGLRGFFKGAGATAIRDAPYAGVYLGFYESSKNILSPVLLSTDTSVSGSASALVNFSSGALAATLATTVTNPPDVVKTRLQLMPERYFNAIQTVRLMVKEEGLRSMWGGLGLRVSRKALSSALAWTVYEEAVRRATAIWSKPTTE